MAQIHNVINRGNWSDAIKRALGVTKSSGGIERFGETLTPVVNLWEKPEWAYLRQEALWSQSINVAAVAAEFGIAVVANPLNSGALVVVELAMISSLSTATTAFIRLMDRVSVAATTTLTGVPRARDFRWGKPAPSAATPFALPFEIGAGTDAAGFTALTQELVSVPVAANTTFQSTPYILKPGDAFIIECTTVNLAFNASFAGRWHQALPGELE